MTTNLSTTDEPIEVTNDHLLAALQDLAADNRETWESLRKSVEALELRISALEAQL